VTDDAYTRDVFEQLHVPPESTRFFIELEQRLRARDRAALRRWRRTAIAAVALAVAAIATTGVMASTLASPTKTFDQTVTCTNLTKGGLPVFSAGGQPTGDPSLDANGKVKTPPPGFFPPTSLWVLSGDTMKLLIFSSQTSGYQLDRTRCVRSKAKPSFGAHGLPAALTLQNGQAEKLGRRCADVAKITMRVHITSDAQGVPLAAKLLIERATSGKPLVYVEWGRQTLRSWSAAGCDNDVVDLP
jgi:hypothetical protein